LIGPRLSFLLYKNMWILYKSNKAQCIYSACIPSRLSYNTDKALSSYRVKPSCKNMGLHIGQLEWQWRWYVSSHGVSRDVSWTWCVPRRVSCSVACHAMWYVTRSGVPCDVAWPWCVSLDMSRDISHCVCVCVRHETWCVAWRDVLHMLWYGHDKSHRVAWCSTLCGLAVMCMMSPGVIGRMACRAMWFGHVVWCSVSQTCVMWRGVLRHVIFYAL
jgi:hypothetical protein